MEKYKLYNNQEVLGWFAFPKGQSTHDDIIRFINQTFAPGESWTHFEMETGNE